MERTNEVLVVMVSVGFMLVAALEIIETWRWAKIVLDALRIHVLGF